MGVRERASERGSARAREEWVWAIAARPRSTPTDDHVDLLGEGIDDQLVFVGLEALDDHLFDEHQVCREDGWWVGQTSVSENPGAADQGEQQAQAEAPHEQQVDTYLLFT